jgi:hypothetical protein
MVVMRHDARKFKEQLDFLTGPGCRVGERTRAEAGLQGLGTTTIVTDRAVIDVVAGGLSLRSVHPGENVQAVTSEMPLALGQPRRGNRGALAGRAAVGPQRARRAPLVQRLMPRQIVTVTKPTP